MRFLQKTADLKFVIDKIKSAVYNAFYRQRSTADRSVFEGKQIFKNPGIIRPDIVYFYSCCAVRSKIQIMEKEKSKHTAGNFLVCDVQEEYAEYLLSILVKHFGIRFQFHFFSDIQKVVEFGKHEEIEVLFIAEECYSAVKEYVKASKTFLLSESVKRQGEAGETVVFRYQSAAKILKIIQAETGKIGNGRLERAGIRTGEKRTVERRAEEGSTESERRKVVKEILDKCEETEEKRTEDVRKHEETFEKTEKYAVEGNMSQKGKKRIRDEPDVKGLIGVYSPIHRIGKTEFALCLGEKIAEKVPVLYINMEGYSGNDFYFQNGKNQDLGDLLYYLKQERVDYGLKTSLMTGQYEKLDYIMPIANEKDLREVTKEEWLTFLDTIMEQCIYQTVILDLGDCILGLYEILKRCDRVYTPFIQDEISMAKMRQYEENLKASGYSDVLKHTVKRRMRVK